MSEESLNQPNDDPSLPKKGKWFKKLFSNSQDNNLRETLEELIVENGDADNEQNSPEKH